MAVCTLFGVPFSTLDGDLINEKKQTNARMMRGEEYGKIQKHIRFVNNIMFGVQKQKNYAMPFYGSCVLNANVIAPDGYFIKEQHYSVEELNPNIDTSINPEQAVYGYSKKSGQYEDVLSQQFKDTISLSK